MDKREYSARMLGDIDIGRKLLSKMGWIFGRCIKQEGSVPRHHGSRHRAAVGITLESDCVVVVVSEETGGVALVEQGVVETDVSHDELHEKLRSRLEGRPGGSLPSDREGDQRPLPKRRWIRKKGLTEPPADRTAAKQALAEEV